MNLTRFFGESKRNLAKFAVAPFAGAWIEIAGRTASPRLWTVAPFAGAWIEIRIAARYDL